MKETICQLDDCTAINAGDYILTTDEIGALGTKIDVNALRHRGIPSLYLDVIDKINDSTKKQNATLKISSLLLFLRPKLREQGKLQSWMISGKLPECTYNGATTMNSLYVLAKKINSLHGSISNYGTKLNRYNLKPKQTKTSLEAIANLTEKIALAQFQICKIEELFLNSLDEIEAILGSGRKEW